MISTDNMAYPFGYFLSCLERDKYDGFWGV